MEATLLEATSAAWSSISALAVLLLGAASLAGGRTRPPGSVAFGGFALVWALQLLAAQSWSYVPAALAPRLHLANVALLLPVPYFLMQLARAFARDGGRSTAWRMGTAATLAIALATLALLLLAPSLLYEGTSLVSGTPFPVWGPLYAPLVVAPFFLAMGVALWALDGARRASATARASHRHALLAAGFAVFVGFSAANNLAFYAMDLALAGGEQLASVYALLFAGLSALALAIGARAAKDAWRAEGRKMRRPAALVAGAVAVPFLWGAVEGIVAWAWLPRFQTIGLWRLAGVALIAYALASSRIPELAPRSRHTVATALGVAGAATLGGLAIGAFMLFAPGAPVLLLAATAIPLAALSPSVRLARRALRVTAVPDRTEAALGRRIDTYRAALESALARDGLDADEAFLAGLRDELGITPDVHDALLAIARANVLPAPRATHPGYERLRLLGEGAHGRAWLARRRADDELVVLKETAEHDEAARESLVRQVRVAQRVRHPRVVRIQALVEGPRGPFLVMDHMPGGSLADALGEGPIEPTRAARYAIDVLEGLAALHDAGITHGDVKAGNVLLDEEGRASVADFGLARASSPQATQTFVGAQGTLAAMAPEQLNGGAPTPACDLYATGALLYRLLAGEHYLPFGGLDETRARSLVLGAPPRLPHPRVPTALEPVLRRALAKDPAQRYASAHEMRRALVDASSGL